MYYLLSKVMTHELVQNVTLYTQVQKRSSFATDVLPGIKNRISVAGPDLL